MDFNKKISIFNKKAKFEYEFLYTINAGIVLKGTEIKSLRIGKANLSDAYCLIKSGELFINNLHISEYKFGTYNNHEPKRQRKLLITKIELKKLHNKVKEKGLSIIPYKIFLTDRGLAKIEIALAKGKKTHDKRESIKEKDMKRNLDRIKKNYN